MSDYYNQSGYPSTNEAGNSAPARAEFTAIGNAFAKLPVLTGMNLRLTRVNASGSGLESVTPITANIIDTSSPQTLTNKTLTSPVISTPTGITASDVSAIPTSQREAANGVAGLDGNSEVIRLPAGSAIQVAAGRAGATKRADGAWEIKVNQEQFKAYLSDYQMHLISEHYESIMQKIIRISVDEVTALFAHPLGVVGFGMDFGLSMGGLTTAAGAIGTTTGFGYNFGNNFGNVTVTGTAITVAPATRGAAASFFFSKA